ncbi:MAG: oligosaccharide flippase family protein [Halobacteriota archaeon]
MRSGTRFDELVTTFQKVSTLIKTTFVSKVLRGMSVLGFGFIISKLISMVEELFVGRYLGIEIYGIYLVVLAISSMLGAFMTLGLPKAVIKLISEKKTLISEIPINALYMAFFTALLVSIPVIVIGSSDNVLHLLGITKVELLFGYLIGVLLTIYAVAQSFRLALYEMKYVVIADITYWAIALAFFVLFHNLMIGLAGICIGSVTASIILMNKIPLIKSNLSLNSIRSLTPLTAYLSADSVLGISAQQISILYLNIIASFSIVGIFGAHSRSSIFVISPLATIVGMAVYPTFCSIDRRSQMRVGRYLLYLGPPIIFVVIGISYLAGLIFLHVFRVQVIASLLLLLSIFSSVFLYNRIWDKLVTACEGAKIVAWGVLFGTIAFLSVMLLLTPLIGGMMAIASGMISNEIVYSVVLLLWFKSHVMNKFKTKTISNLLHSD